MKSKDEWFRIRVSASLKREIERMAEERGESLSVVIRDALRWFLTQQEEAQQPKEPDPEKNE